MDWQAVRLTLQLAAATTGVLAVVGVPLAYGLATSRRRSTLLVEALVALPLVLPPTVLGFYLLMLTGPDSPLGAAYHRATGSLLPFSFPGLLLGSVLGNLPFAVRPFMAAFAALDKRLIEAAWCLGESRLRTFFRVTLPLCSPGITAGLVLTFAHTIGEFGIVLMIGGNIPGLTRTLSIAVYDDVQALNYAAAYQTSAVLLAFSFVALLLMQRLVRRGATV